MVQAPSTAPILMAEDDDGDRLLTRKALEKNQVSNPLVTVSNGEELLDYLYRRGKFAQGAAVIPCFILLDLNMPRVDGREALKVLKSDERLRKIPVVVLTTSRSPEDLSGCYELGANSYITKPNSFNDLVKVIESLNNYWLKIVEFPRGDGEATVVE